MHSSVYRSSFTALWLGISISNVMLLAVLSVNRSEREAQVWNSPPRTNGGEREAKKCEREWATGRMGEMLRDKWKTRMPMTQSVSSPFFTVASQILNKQWAAKWEPWGKGLRWQQQSLECIWKKKIGIATNLVPPSAPRWLCVLFESPCCVSPFLCSQLCALPEVHVKLLCQTWKKRLCFL